jgi:hypothetical protein
LSEYAELVTTQSSEIALGRECGAKSVCYLSQDAIASAMAMLVVDCFETIQVK